MTQNAKPQSIKFSDALETLNSKDRRKEAEQLKSRITAHFSDVLTEKQIMASSIEDLTEAIELFNLFYSKPVAAVNALEAHIDELKNKGHFVVYGANYHGKC